METRPNTADIRVMGSEGDCRAFLDTIRTVVDVADVEGPFPNRRGGVRFYATAGPRRRRQPAAGNQRSDPGG